MTDLTLIEGGKGDTPPKSERPFLELPPRSLESLHNDLDLGLQSLCFQCARLSLRGALVGVQGALEFIGHTAEEINARESEQDGAR